MQCMKIHVTLREQRGQGYREPPHRLLLFFGAPTYLPSAGTCLHPHRGSGWACKSPLWCLCGYRVAAALMPFVASSPQHPRPPRRGAGMGESRVQQHLCHPLAERPPSSEECGEGSFQSRGGCSGGESAAPAPALALLPSQCVSLGWSSVRLPGVFSFAEWRPWIMSILKGPF